MRRTEPLCNAGIRHSARAGTTLPPLPTPSSTSPKRRYTVASATLHAHETLYHRGKRHPAQSGQRLHAWQSESGDDTSTLASVAIGSGTAQGSGGRGFATQSVATRAGPTPFPSPSMLRDRGLRRAFRLNGASAHVIRCVETKLLTLRCG
jgi:hypothetical protein